MELKHTNLKWWHCSKSKLSHVQFFSEKSFKLNSKIESNTLLLQKFLIAHKTRSIRKNFKHQRGCKFCTLAVQLWKIFFKKIIFFNFLKFGISYSTNGAPWVETKKLAVFCRIWIFVIFHNFYNTYLNEMNKSFLH